jgi:hypothetical protein
MRQDKKEKRTGQRKRLPGLEELVDHETYFLRVKLEGTASSAGTKAGAAGRPETAEFALRGFTLDLDGHAPGTLHLRLEKGTISKNEKGRKI